MKETNTLKVRLKALVILLAVFVLFSLVMISFNPTISRYIKNISDEIQATYTSLYFDTTGHDKSVSLDGNTGYVSFELMNYIDDDVTQRDIVYKIEEPSVYYDVDGNAISLLTGNENLYVKDVWGQPKKIGNDSSKYEVNVVKNDGEFADEAKGTYLFEYEKLNNSAVGKKHNVTVQLSRKEKLNSGTINEMNIEDINRVENISIVISLLEPYEEVFIININVSNKLISFSTALKETFDIETHDIYVQSVDTYQYDQNGVQRTSAHSDINKVTNFSSRAFKVTLSWENMILNKKVLDQNHIPYNGDSSNIDITKPYVESITNDKGSGTLVIYVPQGSDFNLNYLIYDKQLGYSLSVKVEICVYDNSLNYFYELYNETNYHGYVFDQDNWYSLINVVI